MITQNTKIIFQGDITNKNDTAKMKDILFRLNNGKSGAAIESPDFFENEFAVDEDGLLILSSNLFHDFFSFIRDTQARH